MTEINIKPRERKTTRLYSLIPMTAFKTKDKIGTYIFLNRDNQDCIVFDADNKAVYSWRKDVEVTILEMEISIFT